MKKLAVPYIRQKNDGECLIACAEMVMAHYGLKENSRELKEFEFASVGESLGLYHPQIGIYLLKQGLKVTIDTLNPYLFNVNDIGKSQDKIFEKIKSLNIKNDDFEKPRQYFLNFMEMGGTLNAANIVKKIITSEIDNGNPVIIPFVSRMVYGHHDGYNFHSNVIFGYDDDNFFLHDPEETEYGGGTKTANQDLVINAFHMAGHADFDNACIIKVSL